MKSIWTNREGIDENMVPYKWVIRNGPKNPKWIVFKELFWIDILRNMLTRMLAHNNPFRAFGPVPLKLDSIVPINPFIWCVEGRFKRWNKAI